VRKLLQVRAVLINIFHTTNLKEFYCGDIGIKSFRVDFSLLVKNNRRSEKIALRGGQECHYQVAATVLNINQEDTQPTAAIKEIFMTYLKLDLNNLNYIMTLTSVRQLTVKAVYEPATK
jgi:hypothetical protein